MILSLKIGLKKRERLNLNSAQAKLMTTETRLLLLCRLAQWLTMLISLPMQQRYLLLRSALLLMIILNLRLFLIKRLNIQIDSA